MNLEFLHMQKLAGLITESEYKVILDEYDNSITPETNDAQINKDKLIQQLIALVSTGEIDNEGIKDINYQLISARKKHFSSKISPEARKISSLKSKATKEKEKQLNAIHQQAFNNIGIAKGSEGEPDKLALSIGLHHSKILQDKFDDEVNKLST